MVAGIVAGVGLAIAFAVAALALGGDSSANDGSTATVPAEAGEPIELPLNLMSVGFDGGTVTEIDPDDGPAAASYCGRRAETAGLVGWRGNRLTDEGGQRRVAQLVARYASAVEAAAAAASQAAIASCGRWESTTDGVTTVFAVAQVDPETIHGDETFRFDLTATTDDAELHLRTLLIRTGPELAHYTYVSTDPTDLALLDNLVG